MDIKDLIKRLRDAEYQAYLDGDVDMYGLLGNAADSLEKQIPRKPIGTYTDYKCPVCSRRVRSGKGSSCHQRDNFCQRCGQALDWEGA